MNFEYGSNRHTVVRRKHKRKKKLKVYPGKRIDLILLQIMGGSSMVRAGVLYASDLGSIPSRPIIYVDMV